MIFVFILIGLIVAGAVALTIIGLRNPHSMDDQQILARLEEFSTSGREIDLRDLEMAMPFSERVLFPMARKLGELATRFTPQNALNNIARKLEQAGAPASWDPTVVLSLQFLCALLMGGVVGLLFWRGTLQWPLGRVIILVLLFTVLGYYFPQLWLTSKVNKRQKEIRKALPDALDLLTICVEAGLGFDSAMAKVADKWQTELSLAFTRVITEIQLGKTRRAAMRDMADRIGLSELSSFVAAVIQSEQLGVSLAKVLRVQSDQMRIKRRQRAEEEAHKAPVKMIIPMGLLIFPALMVVLLSPAVFRMINSSLGDLFK